MRSTDIIGPPTLPFIGNSLQISPGTSVGQYSLVLNRFNDILL